MTRPFELEQLDHLVLRVADLDRSLGFYCHQLGCTLERSLPELGLYQLRAGQHLIDLVPIGSRLGGDQRRAEQGLNLDHFCLLIDAFDADAILQWLDDAGIEHSEVAERYGATGQGPSVYIQDPDGNTLELKGRNGLGSTPKTG